MTTRPRRKPRKADNAQHTEELMLNHGDTIEVIARRIHAEWEVGFPAFTRQKWDELLPHTKGAFMLRALEEFEAK